MQQYSFGTIITSVNNLLFATHLPFIVEQKHDHVLITSHLARANPQALQLEGEILVIFTEPHAYISPAHYDKELSVPTWNYIAVHAYGKAIIITDKTCQLTMMEQMITNYDSGYLQQWHNLPDDFKTKMLNGIVAFEIKVTSLESKSKLSQNRTEIERERIINAFENSSDNNETLIAAYMKKV